MTKNVTDCKYSYINILERRRYFVLRIFHYFPCSLKKNVYLCTANTPLTKGIDTFSIVTDGGVAFPKNEYENSYLRIVTGQLRGVALGGSSWCSRHTRPCVSVCCGQWSGVRLLFTRRDVGCGGQTIRCIADVVHYSRHLSSAGGNTAGYRFTSLWPSRGPQPP